MSDESRTPDHEPAASEVAPEASPQTGPETGLQQGPEHGPERGEPERTGIIDLHDTRAIPSEPASTAPGQDDDAWFDVFGDPASTGVPARADSSWGSDRADALAEEAHRAAYTPPVESPTPDSHAPGSVNQPGSPSASAGAYYAATAAAGTTAPAGSTGAPGPYGTHGAYGPTDASGIPGSPVAPPGGEVPGGPGVPLTDETAASRPRRRRGLIVTGVVALCLLSGVIGGVAGHVAEDRINLGGTTLPTPGPGATSRPAGSVANIAANVLPSVVTIKVDGGSEGSATGSGFVIDRLGHVLTNNHVVEAAPNGEIQVVLSTGDTEKATVVGRDASYDLAVLKIARSDLTPLTLGQSDKVVVGDQVIAVGAPLGLDQTVTTGIVSAMNRPVTPGDGTEASYINAIQTDAAINPGNSGGPLLDMTGQVIGVNSAIARVPGTSGSTGGSIGLGFAIPSDQARRTADQLIATGKATHPIIGVKLNRTFTGEGAEVDDSGDAVTSGGPAAKAGVKPGDVIVAFEGKRVRTPDQLIVSIRSRAVGDTVTLTVQRDGHDFDLKMTLEAEPAK
ncbi:trypsin-like peptidase domain-containing protein [Monashia sp. NPDC004114]